MILELEKFFVKGQMVSILGFAGQVVSVAYSPPPPPFKNVKPFVGKQVLGGIWLMGTQFCLRPQLPILAVVPMITP